MNKLNQQMVTIFLLSLFITLSPWAFNFTAKQFRPESEGKHSISWNYTQPLANANIQLNHWACGKIPSWAYSHR